MGLLKKKANVSSFFKILFTEIFINNEYRNEKKHKRSDRRLPTLQKGST